MALEVNDTLWHGAFDGWESTIGNNPLLRLYTGGAPAKSAAPTGTLLASGTLPLDWLAAAASGTKALLGAWTLTGSGTGVAGYYRIVNSGDTLTAFQGLAGSQIVLNTNASSAAFSNVLNFAVSTSGAGVQVGMRVTGAGVPVDTYVVQVTGTTAVVSRTLIAGVSSAASITFKWDLTIDNASIVPAQTINVLSWAMTRLG